MDFDSGKYIFRMKKTMKAWITKKIGYVYSTPILPEFLTGYEFIKFFTDINKKKIKILKHRKNMRTWFVLKEVTLTN